MSTAAEVKKALAALATPEKSAASRRFFKTGKGEYGEGDRFLGVTVPDQRRCVRAFRGMEHNEIFKLLRSRTHEHRLTALLLLVDAYQRAKKDPLCRDLIVQGYLEHLRWINNWDLVDSSAPQIWGNWLLSRDRAPLYQQVQSQNLWERRIAMMATQELIKHGESRDALALAELLLSDPEDLLHKASGWMLREVGQKVALKDLRGFLKAHSQRMPRTMLRYAIEKLPEQERKSWLAR